MSAIPCLPVSCQGNLSQDMKSAVKFTLSSCLSLAVPSSSKNQSVQTEIIQCKGQDPKSGRVSELGVAKWSFVRQVSIASMQLIGE